MKLLYTIITFSIVINLSAQTKTEYGFADSSIPELAQFEYYRGNWKSQIEMKQENGSFEKLEGGANVQGKYLNDGRTFQTQFSTENGFFSTDIRTYNTTTKEWNALFLNAKAQRWHEFTSKIINGNMTTMVLGGYSGKEDFDLKVVDVVITNNHFLKNVYRSKDNGITWEHVFKINMKKVEE